MHDVRHRKAAWQVVAACRRAFVETVAVKVDVAVVEAEVVRVFSRR